MHFENRSAPQQESKLRQVWLNPGGQVEEVHALGLTKFIHPRGAARPTIFINSLALPLPNQAALRSYLRVRCAGLDHPQTIWLPELRDAEWRDELMLLQARALIVEVSS